MIKDYVETDAVENSGMPPVKVKLYLSRFDALRELNDNYPMIHQDHDDGAVSNIINDDLLVVLIDLGILKFNNQGNDGLDVEGSQIDNESMASFLGIISHEAYHLACRWMETLGEDKPGEEEMAYHVEAISSALYKQLLDYFEKGQSQ